MKKPTRLLLLYIFAVIAMIYAVGQLTIVPTWANVPAPGGTCCSVSSDCPGTMLCYQPSGGLADCTTDRPNYCKPGGGN